MKRNSNEFRQTLRKIVSLKLLFWSTIFRNAGIERKLSLVTDIPRGRQTTRHQSRCQPVASICVAFERRQLHKFPLFQTAAASPSIYIILRRGRKLIDSWPPIEREVYKPTHDLIKWALNLTIISYLYVSYDFNSRKHWEKYTLNNPKIS